ncbi:MAG: hypothetical protein E7270_08705 [Lachnospiraceae bacterium]|nr:hypothetical protein [Lachnospiraceae bacterium]
MMKKYIEKLKTFNTLRIVLFVILVVYTMLCIINYRTKIFNIKENYVDTYLEDLMQENNSKIQLKIEEKFSVLETIGDCIESVGLENEETVNNLVRVLGTNEQSSYSFVAYPDGRVVGDVKVDSDYVDDEYFKLAMEGERRMSDIYQEKDGEYIRFAIPIRENDEVVATLQCAYNITMFNDLIENGAFNKKGSTFVIQRDGSMITRKEATDETPNMFESLTKNAGKKSEKTITKMVEKIKKGKSGVTSVKSGKHKRFICYSKIENSDWCLMTIVSENAVDPQANKIISANSILNVLIISGVVVFLISIIAISIYEHKKQIKA